MNTRPEVAEQVQRFEADTPLGRMATPEEMIGPTVFLLSEAATFCTGVDLLVDGGFGCCRPRDLSWRSAPAISCDSTRLPSRAGVARMA
jgi:NAD(P)-dependent dehydrogenase (short-subunit alcohol dehydrogenase family)